MVNSTYKRKGLGYSQDAHESPWGGNEHEAVSDSHLSNHEPERGWQYLGTILESGKTRTSRASTRIAGTGSTNQLQQRLDNANRHFKRKAAEVFGDPDAIRLLAKLYKSVNLEIDELDTCQQGIALAKLTAANFCEIGAKVIYITEAGQKFIEAINNE